MVRKPLRRACVAQKTRRMPLELADGSAQARHDAFWLLSWSIYIWRHAQYSRCRCAGSCQFALNFMLSHVAVLNESVSKKLSSPSENNLLEFAFFNVGCKCFEARTAFAKNDNTNTEAVPSQQLPLCHKLLLHGGVRS